MDWASIIQYGELCLGFVLIARLLSLRLHRVYRYFCVYLLADLSGTLIWAIDKRIKGTPFYFDYRIAWLAQHVVVWVFTLLTVYALLDAILANLPGILKLSHTVLNISFLAAFVIGLLTGIPEYRAAAHTQSLIGRLAHFVSVGFVLDRVIACVALLALLCILLFLVWFPVEMSRNLAAFFGGFVVYFALKACLMLVLSLGSYQQWVDITSMSMSIAGLSGAVFAYWAIFITKAGETVRATVPVPTWHGREQDLAVAQLEAMNASLLRAVRR